MYLYVYTKVSTKKNIVTTGKSIRDSLLTLPHDWRQSPHDLRVVIKPCTELDYWQHRCRELERQLQQVLRHA